MIRRSLVAAAALALATGAAILFAPESELRTEIRLDAPPTAVWDQIARPEAQARWNPVILAMSGTLQEGQRFEMTLAIEGGGTLHLTPEVIRRDERQALCWRGRVFVPRFLDGEHCWLLFADGGDTRLVNTERFTGVMLWFADVEAWRPGFEAANAALAATLADGLPG